MKLKVEASFRGAAILRFHLKARTGVGNLLGLERSLKTEVWGRKGAPEGASSVRELPDFIAGERVITTAGAYPTTTADLTATVQILTPSGCVLREETHSGVKVTNGFLNVVVGSVAAAGGQNPTPVLSLPQVFDNSTERGSGRPHLRASCTFLEMPQCTLIVLEALMGCS